MSTDSIMALFGPTSTSSQPQMFSSPQQQQQLGQQLGGLGQQLGGLGQQLGGLGLLAAPGGFNPAPHQQQVINMILGTVPLLHRSYTATGQ